MDNASIKKLEADLWESADLLRAGSKLTSNQYCMPINFIIEEAHRFVKEDSYYGAVGYNIFERIAKEGRK